MKVIYVSTVVAKTKMEEIIQNSLQKPLQSIQKFHRLICEGFILNNIEVKTISSIPMSRKISKKIFWKEKRMVENGVEYQYITFFNIKILRQVCTFFGTIIKVLGELRNKKEKIFICDILNTTIASTTLILSKIFHFQCIAIVTDLPRDIGGKRSISRKINEYLQNKYDGYILLTEEMNNVVNRKNKKYVVIEGTVNKKEDLTQPAQKYENKVCIYAGGLYQKYGVLALIKAFQKMEGDEELHLYGSGELEDYIKTIQSERIKFFGVVANEIVVQEEKKSTLLINPRFTNEDYTEYSFPSKNMEYMSTGTPVLTTNLPGMPNEYKEYVYLFEEENVDGFFEKLKEVLGKDKKALELQGNKAKDFVYNYKNNQVQTQKIIKMIEE